MYSLIGMRILARTQGEVSCRYLSSCARTHSKHQAMQSPSLSRADATKDPPRETPCTEKESEYVLLKVALLEVDNALLTPQHASCAGDIKHKPCTATTPAVCGTPIRSRRRD